MNDDISKTIIYFLLTVLISVAFVACFHIQFSGHSFVG